MKYVTLFILIQLQALTFNIFTAADSTNPDKNKTEITNKDDFFHTLIAILSGQETGWIRTNLTAGASCFEMETHKKCCKIITNLDNFREKPEYSTQLSAFQEAQSVGIKNPGEVSAFLLRLRSQPQMPITPRYIQQSRREQRYLEKITNILHCNHRTGLISSDNGKSTICCLEYDSDDENNEVEISDKETQTDFQ